MPAERFFLLSCEGLRARRVVLRCVFGLELSSQGRGGREWLGRFGGWNGLCPRLWWVEAVVCVCVCVRKMHVQMCHGCAACRRGPSQRVSPSKFQLAWRLFLFCRPCVPGFFCSCSLRPNVTPSFLLFSSPHLGKYLARPQYTGGSCASGLDPLVLLSVGSSHSLFFPLDAVV